jgi:hypothetical protein
MMSHRFKVLGGVIMIALALAVNVGTASAATAYFVPFAHPATLTGSSLEVAELPQELFCSSGFSGEITTSRATSVNLTPTYGALGWGCWIGETQATVAMEGCTYTFIAGVVAAPGAEGSRQIVCPSGKEIKITAGECVVKIPPTPEPVGPFYYRQLGTIENGYVEAEYEGSLTYWQNSKCGGSEGVHSATLRGGYIIKNTNKYIWLGQ